MRYDQRADGELLELAQSGWSPAFAVLVHRHAPALLAAFADDPDPLERVTDVFVRAMRQLPERDPAAPVTPWLFALAGRPVPDVAAPVEEETLDPIWRQLAVRWPDGRHVHRQGGPYGRTIATVLGALALGVAVPTIVLGIPASSDPETVESVRAQPLEEDPVEEAEPEDLPTFEFPDISRGEPEPTITGPVDTAPAAPSQPPPPATVAPTEPATPPPAETEEPPTEPTEPVEPTEPTEPVEPPPGTDDGDGGGPGDGGDDGSDGDEEPTLPVVGGGEQP